MSTTMTATAETTAPASPALELTALDRCDTGACGAQARMLAALPGGGVLLFCRHHGEAARAALLGAGAVLETHYEELLPAAARPEQAPAA